jgi:hypothetical protein
MIQFTAGRWVFIYIIKRNNGRINQKPFFYGNPFGTKRNRVKEKLQM